MAPIRIILIDDHTLFRSGIKALLSRQSDIEVVGEARDGLEGVKLVEQTPADVVLLDVDMPVMNGVEALAQIRESRPDLRVLMLTVSEDCDTLGECLHLGAKGYLLKNIDQDVLLRSIHLVYDGVNAISPQMMSKWITHNDSPASLQDGSGKGNAAKGKGRPEQLTRRERQTLAWLARGASNKDIARGLDLAESTVKVHVQSILRKLGLTSRVQAAIYALENNLDLDALAADGPGDDD